VVVWARRTTIKDAAHEVWARRTTIKDAAHEVWAGRTTIKDAAHEVWARRTTIKDAAHESVDCLLAGWLRLAAKADSNTAKAAVFERRP